MGRCLDEFAQFFQGAGKLFPLPIDEKDGLFTIALEALVGGQGLGGLTEVELSPEATLGMDLDLSTTGRIRGSIPNPRTLRQGAVFRRVSSRKDTFTEALASARHRSEATGGTGVSFALDPMAQTSELVAIVEAFL